MKKLILIICVFFSLINRVDAVEEIAKKAKSAILMDYSSGEILYDKNMDEKLAPASMTKIMSMLLIMEAIDNDQISLDDDVIISKEAAGMGGSQVFIQEGETYKVSELLKGIAIASGNDAVVAMAEKIGGTVDNFVTMMNNKAHELGLLNTNFVNPHGLDAEGHYSSSKDMAIMARELLKHDRILEYTKIYEDYLNKNDGSKTWLVNTNKLVRFYNGADGLKTGFTQNAGYCLTATAFRNDLRLIAVVMGEESATDRSEDIVTMFNYGFNTYKNQKIFDKDDSLGKVKVEKGKKESVDIYLVNDVNKLLKINEEAKNYSINILFNKITAPYSNNDVIGKAEIIDNEGSIIDIVDITVKEDVKKANIWDYIKKNAKYSFGGKVLV